MSKRVNQKEKEIEREGVPRPLRVSISLSVSTMLKEIALWRFKRTGTPVNEADLAEEAIAEMYRKEQSRQPEQSEARQVA